MKIDANGTEIRVMGDVVNEEAYISLTDIAKYKNPDNAFIIVANWMRNHSTISFLGLWEQIHNPNFKPIEFERTFQNQLPHSYRCCKGIFANSHIISTGNGIYICFRSGHFKYGFVRENRSTMEK